MRNISNYSISNVAPFAKYSGGFPISLPLISNEFPNCELPVISESSIIKSLPHYSIGFSADISF